MRAYDCACGHSHGVVTDAHPLGRFVPEMLVDILHAVVVELLVELMDHAVGHAENETATREFEQQLAQFDVEAFVDAYREQRDFEDEFDTPA